MTGKDDLEFVPDGYERARAAAVGSIRRQVEAEYAERLRYAGWLRRLLLRLEINREIERRLDRIAPPDALYFSAPR